MTTVYLLSTGEYSDYTVEGVFSTEGLADKAAATYDGAEVKAFELDGLDTSVRFALWTCYLTHAGDVKWERISWRGGWHAGTPRRGSEGPLDTAIIGHNFRGWSDRSAEDARRLAAEARQRHLQDKA